MAIFDTSIGIDLKPKHLILTLLRKSFKKIRLVDYGVYSLLSEGQKEEREAQAIGLINSFISKHHLGKERVSISIPRENVIARFIKLPVATKENLRKVLEYEIPKYTPFEKEEIYFDYHILKEEKEWIHLFAVFVKKTEVEYYLSLMKKIGIQPVSIQIPSTAALNLFFFNRKWEKGEISVLLDVDDSFFVTNLIQDGRLIESFHQTLPTEEKQLKIESTLKRLGLKDDASAKLNFFLYGLGVDEGMLASLKETNMVKGVLPAPLTRIEAGKGVSELHRVYSSVGVPLKGLIKTQLDINLLPVEMRKKVIQIGKPLSMMLTSLALILSLTWGVGGFFRYKNELNEVTAELRQVRPGVEAVEKLQKEKEELGKAIYEFENITLGESGKVEILEELTKLLPDSVWIWNFKYVEKEIEISGFADSASDLIPLLDKSPLFEKVEFLAPVTKERGLKGDGEKEKERFKIKARLERRRAGH